MGSDRGAASTMRWTRWWWGITSRTVNWILDADIRSFFDAVSQNWLIRFLEHRIVDRRILRRIRRWLKAGILEDGVVAVSDTGTGQGSVISPLLANVYPHYVFDHSVQRQRPAQAWQTRDLQLPGLHLDQRPVAARQVPAQAEIPARTTAGEAPGDQRRAAATQR